MLKRVVKEREFVNGEVPTGTIDGSNVSYSTLHPFDDGSLKVYLNGLTMRSGFENDYIIVDDTTINFNYAPDDGDTVEVDYIKS